MKLKLVKKQDEAAGTKSFFFTADKNFSWQAGQYAYLTLGNITKQFTIASSPTEKFIQITTRIRKGSEFKQNLDKIEIDEEIEARAPFGSFVLANDYPLITITKLNLNHLFLAGGIGITPFRSMIKYNIDRKLNSPMFLIYSNSDNDFVFKKELEIWQKENKFIKVHYHNSSVSGHVNSNKIEEIFEIWNLEFGISPTMWVVGPSPFVNAMEDILEQLNIESDMIRTEKFIGY